MPKKTTKLKRPFPQFDVEFRDRCIEIRPLKNRPDVLIRIVKSSQDNQYLIPPTVSWSKFWAVDMAEAKRYSAAITQAVRYAVDLNIQHKGKR